MKYKNKLFIIGLLLLVLLSVSIVSAEVNVTETIQIDNGECCDDLSNAENESLILNYENDDNELRIGVNSSGDDNLGQLGHFIEEKWTKHDFGYSVKIYSTGNINTNYKSNEKFYVKYINASSGNPLVNYPVTIYFDDESQFVGDQFDGYTNSEGIFQVSLSKLFPGNFVVKTDILLDSVNELGCFNDNCARVIIKKLPSKLSAKTKKGFTSYSTLKVVIKDNKGNNINEGSVKFTINGKSYKVNVKKGVATKSVKLPKIKTYVYKATFTSEHYATKSIKSKIVVKKAPTLTIKIGKYSCKISYADYIKIKKAEKAGRFIKKYDTGKTIKYKVYADKKITKTKKKLYSYGTYTTYYIPNSNALKAPPGYKYAGKQFTIENGIEKVYMVYKKTSYKKVLVKTPKTKVYIYIESTPWGTSANLYHLKSVYDGEYIYYSGNYKSIF